MKYPNPNPNRRISITKMDFIKLRIHTFSDSGSGSAFRNDYMDPAQKYLIRIRNSQINFGPDPSLEK